MAEVSGISSEAAERAVEEALNAPAAVQNQVVGEGATPGDFANISEETPAAAAAENAFTRATIPAAPIREALEKRDAEPASPTRQASPMSISRDVARSMNPEDAKPATTLPYEPLSALQTYNQTMQKQDAISEARSFQGPIQQQQPEMQQPELEAYTNQETVESDQESTPLQTQAVEPIEEETVVKPAKTQDVSPTAVQEKVKEKVKQEQADKASKVISSGITQKQKTATPLGFINKVFSGAVNRIIEGTKKKLKSYSASGNSFYADLLSDANVPPHCVSIGSENLLEAIREPSSNIIELVNEKTGDNLTLEECLQDISLLVNAINRAEIECVLQKSPNNRRDSIQVRTLRAHIGVDMRVHPTQLKAYNADFDGDNGKLLLNQGLLNKYERAMSVLIGIDGKQNIDGDFFPLDPLQDGSRSKVLKLMTEEDFAWNDLIAYSIVDAYIEAANDPTRRNWVKLLRAIDDVCARLAKGDAKLKQKLISRTFASLYNFGTARRSLQFQEASERMDLAEEFNSFVAPPGSDAFVTMMIDIHNEIVAGRPAPNYYEFAKMYSKFTGVPLNEDGKPTRQNVPFRLVADFGKAINRSEFFILGESTPILVDSNLKEIPFDKLWQITCSAAESKLIASRMHMGSHELRAAKSLRELIVKKVGFPGDVDESGKPRYESYQDFVNQFVAVYNYYNRMLEVGKKIRFRADMRISRNFGWDGITEWKKIGKAFVDIYGDQSVERMFPSLMRKNYDERSVNKRFSKDGVLAKYLDMTVAQFAICNKIDVRMAELKKNKQEGTWGELDILRLVADRRRADTQAYHGAWKSWTELMVDVIPDIQRCIVNEDYNRYSRNLLEMMHFAGADMFGYFEMDDFSKFIQSEWGQKLLLCEDVESFRSIWVSMLMEYRLAKANKVLEEKSEIASITTDVENQIEILDALDAVYDSELTKLASSSYAWSAIVDENRNGNPTFVMLKEAKENKLLDSDNNIKRNGAAWILQAKDFWLSEEANEYNSVYNVLVSDLPYSTKMNILVDVVRVKENFKEFMSFEMLGQLTHHPDRVHEGSPFDMNAGLDTKPFNTSMDRITSMMTYRPRQARRFARDLVFEAKSNLQAFEEFITKLADDPGFLVHIDPHLAADLMAAGADPDFANTEKGKQQYRANGYYQAGMQARNGGLLSHIQQTDNKVLNTMSYDQVTPIDIIRILGHPKETYYIHDEFGRPAPISREIICGDNSTVSLIRWIEDNPQMAYLFRRYSVSIRDDIGDEKKVKGSSSIRGIDNSFSLYLDEGDPRTVEQRAFQLLCDRPRFFALVSLLTPVKLDTGRTLADKYNDGIHAMCGLLAYLAQYEGKTTPEMLAEAFAKQVGLTQEKILKATEEGKFDDASGFDSDQAITMYGEALDEATDCITLLARNNVIAKSAAGKPSTYEWGIDNNSVTSYYTVKGQFNGCRTNTMIGVEGNETNRNQMLKLFINHRPDRFFTVDANTSASTIAYLARVTDHKDLTYEIEQNGYVLFDREEYEDLADFVPDDPTLESNKKRQLQSIARYFEIKRDSAAEEFNMKSVKFVDDLINSVTKYGKFDYDKGDKTRRAINGTNDRTVAIYRLAEALKAVDVELGYKDFPLSDYLNRADLMIVQNSDGSFAIRTLEQLSIACRNRLSSEARYSGNADTIMAELQSIVETVGTEADPLQIPEKEIVHDVLYGVYRYGSGGSFKADRAVLERSSSVERNYSLLHRFYDDFSRSYIFHQGMEDEIQYVPAETAGKLGEKQRRFVPPRREMIQEYSDEQFKKLDKATADSLRGLAYPYTVYDINKDKNVFGKRDAVYDYLGEASDKDLRLYPGPQNLVLFRGENKKVLDQCRRYGITVVFDGLENVPDNLQADAQEVGNDLYLVPFFYMKLNGATGDQLGPAPAQMPYHPTNYTICVEDTTGEIRAGDASAHITKDLGDRTVIVRSDTVSFTAEKLFPNVLETYKGNNYYYQMDFCIREEVQKYIVDEWDDAAIDIGITPDNPMYDDEMKKMKTRIEEYVSRFDSANSVSFLTDKMKDDRIAGFVKIIVNNKIVAFAPVIPFHRMSSESVPRNYQISSLNYDHETRSFQMSWRYEGDIRGQSVKFFEGIGASNKMMTNGDYIRSRKLANGMPVDVMYSTKSIASRLFASNKRINTLVSLMMMPRVDLRYAYNFADLSDSFPGNDEMRAALERGTLTKTEWFDFYDSGQKFHADDEINEVVKFIVGRCKEYGTVNPSTILANKFYDEEGNSQIKLLTTEFEAFMDTSYNFQDGLMKLMHDMTSIQDGVTPLCPRGIEADSRNALFKPNLGTGDQYGVLQMLVPHYASEDDAEPYYALENVYISPGFFGDVFSGFGRFTVDSGLANEDLVVANNLSESMLLSYAAIGASEFAPIDQMLMRGMSVTQDSVLIDKFKESLHKRRELGDEYGRILTLTGHRPDKDPEKDKLWGMDYTHPNYKIVKDQLKDFIQANHIDTIVSGMAIGFDTLGAEVAQELGLKLVAAVPFKGQERKWPAHVKKHYHELLDYARETGEVKIVSEGEYSAHKLQVRNEWMVDNGDLVAALWDGTSGGTANCVDYALDMYANIARLNPQKLSDGFKLFAGTLDEDKQDTESEPEEDIIENKIPSRPTEIL